MKGQKKDFSGWPGDCSEEQLKALEQFRKFVKEELGLDHPRYDDHFLLRFLRARKFNLNDTKKMFQDYINWRKENDVDNIKNYEMTEIEQVREFYPHGYHKTDKLGRSIYIERIGNLQVEKLFQVTNDDRMIKYYIQSYETLLEHIMPHCSRVAGKRVDQTLTILDMKDISLWSMPKNKTYNFIQLAAKLCQNNYPEIMGAMFIVNAPTLFTGVWAVIKPWLDERTRAKIKILGSSYKKELLELIDEENLPDFLGGKSTIPLSKNMGPWNPEGKEMFGKNRVPFDQLVPKDNQNQQIEQIVQKLEDTKITENQNQEEQKVDQQ